MIPRRERWLATASVVFVFWHALGAVRYVAYVVDPRFDSSELPRTVAAISLDQTSWALATLIGYYAGLAFARGAHRPRRTIPVLTLIAAMTVTARYWGTIGAAAAMHVSGPPTLGAFALSFPFHLVLVGAPMALAYAMTYARREQDRELERSRLAADLAEAKLQALRLQLNPHFLFNALSAIATLLHHDVKRADDAVGALASLLRASLATEATHDVSVAEELRLLDAYLAIERVRFPWLTVDVDVAEDIQQERIPPFLLQLLVENAIRHGLAPRGGDGLITIVGRRSDSMMTIRISDNGVGLSDRGARPSPGIGLPNVRARLTHLYGAAARLSVDPVATGGVAATLSIPLTAHRWSARQFARAELAG